MRRTTTRATVPTGVRAGFRRRPVDPTLPHERRPLPPLV
jgi:hypothetical protein